MEHPHTTGRVSCTLPPKQLPAGRARRAPISRLSNPILSNRAFAVLCVITLVIAFILLLSQSTNAATLALSPVDRYWQTEFWLDDARQLVSTDGALTQSTSPTIRPPDPAAPLTSYSWNTPANNSSPLNWNDNTRWTPSGFPNAAGDVANILNSNNQSNFTINLNQLITIGILNIGSTANGRAYTIATGTAGTLNFNNSGSAAQININSNSDGDTISAPVTLTDSLNISNASGNVFTISGGVTAATAGTKTITNQGAGAGGVTISGNIGDGSGAVAVTQNSATSLLTLSGTNTYTGATTLTTGTLRGLNAGATNVLQSFGSSQINLNGGTLQLRANGSGNNQTIAVGNNVVVGGTTTIDAQRNSGGTTNNTFSLGTLTIGANQLNVTGANSYAVSFGATTLTGNATFNPTTANLTLTGTVSGAGFGLTKSGAGTLTLLGANTYDGATTISAGTLQLGNGGTTGSLSTSSTITDNGNFTINQSDTVTQGTDFSGSAISGSGSFTQAGTGTTIFTAANNYTGTTTISAGTLQVGDGGTTGTLGSGAVTDNAALSFNRSNAFTVSNLISGTGSVTQAGAGTTTLSANNTYTGATNVNAGTLFINGDQTAATGAVTVSNSGTVLGGTGIIGGPVTVNANAAIQGGTGSTGQTLTVNNSLTLNDNSIIQLALGPGLTHSTLARTGSGTWTFDSNQAFTFIELPGTTTGNYDNIITGLASDPGTESGWTITNPFYVGTFTYDGTGNIDLTLTAVPEPGTWASASLAFIALFVYQRRRLKRLLKRNC